MREKSQNLATEPRQEIGTSKFPVECSSTELLRHLNLSGLTELRRSLVGILERFFQSELKLHQARTPTAVPKENESFKIDVLKFYKSYLTII